MNTATRVLATLAAALMGAAVIAGPLAATALAEPAQQASVSAPAEPVPVPAPAPAPETVAAPESPEPATPEPAQTPDVLGITLGMTAEQALAEGVAVVVQPYGEGSYGLAPAAPGDVWICGTDAPTYEQMLTETVTTILVKDGSWQTAEGIGVGSTLEEVQTAYPDLSVLDEAGTLFGVANDSGVGLQVSINNGVVEILTVGYGIGTMPVYSC